MKKLSMIGIPALGAIAILMVVNSVPVTGQVKQGKTRLLKTSQLMSGLVKPQVGALNDALKSTPDDDKAWDALATKAALLNEAGHILMADGRCPDNVWADATKALRDGSAAVLKSAEAHDADGAKTALQAMMKSCGACHKAHK